MLRSAAFFLLLAALASADCPPGSIYENFLNQCYNFVSTPKSFFDADNYCLSLGGRLADEANAFEGSYISAITNGATFWIGANLLRNSNWTWTSDAPMNYTNWANGQPSNAYPCGYVDAKSETWKTYPCNTQLPFMCKINPNAPQAGNCPTQPTSTPTPGTCPYDSYCTDDYTFFHNNCMCYKFSNGTYRSFYDANADCAKHGGMLAKIPSKDVNDFLANFPGVAPNYNQNNPWIGLSCTSDTVSSCSWIDGTPLGSYRNFKDFGNPYFYLITNTFTNDNDIGKWKTTTDDYWLHRDYICQKASTRGNLQSDSIRQSGSHGMAENKPLSRERKTVS